MYRSIIVPLDGSTRSHTALPVAAALAHNSDATLDLVRVHLNERPDLNDDPAWDDMFREGEKRHLESLAIAYESVAGKQVGTALLQPPVVGALAAFAESRVEPLLVMAGRGRTGLRRALLGSTSDGLVRRGATPVLVLRAPSADGDPPTWSRGMRPFARLVLPLDGSAYSEGAIAHAVAIARATGAKIRLVRVIGPVMISAIVGAIALQPIPFEDAASGRNDAAHDYLQGIADRIKASDSAIQVSTEVSLATDAANAIIETCRHTAADLVVMASHGRGASRVLLSAVGDRVLRDGPDAILFVRPAASSLPAGLHVAEHDESPAEPMALLARVY